MPGKCRKPNHEKVSGCLVSGHTAPDQSPDYQTLDTKFVRHSTLRFDVLPFCLAGLAVGRPCAVIGFLQTAMGFSHDDYLQAAVGEVN